jgi:hypothetical protein
VEAVAEHDVRRLLEVPNVVAFRLGQVREELQRESGGDEPPDPALNGAFVRRRARS